MKIFNDVTALSEARFGSTNQLVEVKGAGKYLIQSSGGGVTVADGKVAVPVASGTSVNVKQFGAIGDGVTDDTAAMTSAAVFLQSSDLNKLVIPSDNIYFTDEIDFGGAIVEGRDTTISGGGRIVGHSQLIGMKVNGFRQDLNYNYPKESATSTPKLINKIADDEYYILTGGKGLTGGTCFKLRKDVVTATNSVGGNAELLRATRVMNCVGMYGWRKTADTESGTWTDHTVAAADVGHSGASVFRNVTARRTSTLGGYTEFAATVPQDGRLNVAIYGTAGSADSVTIAVDGTTTKTVDPRTWPNSIYAIQLEAAPGSRTVRISHAGTTGIMYVVGINYHRISEVVPGLEYDDWAVYRDATTPFYVIDDSSANDYAIEERTTGNLGGSYHGGETVSAIDFVLDGVAQTLAAEDVVCGVDFYIRQKSLIDWGSGITMNTETVQVFRDGQHELVFSGEGSGLTARTVFAGMSAINEGFTEVVFPTSETIPSDGEVFLGRTNKTILREPNSDALTVTDISLAPDEDSVKGGMRVFAVAGSYNKVYYNPVALGGRNIQRLSFVAVRTFK